MLKWYLIRALKQLGIRIIILLGIINEEATLKADMVVTAYAIYGIISAECPQKSPPSVTNPHSPCASNLVHLYFL